LKNNFDKIILY